MFTNFLYLEIKFFSLIFMNNQFNSRPTLLHWICLQLRMILIMALVILIIRHFLFEMFKVTSPSMEPSLIGDPICGDFLIVNKTAYIWQNPQRWDVVAFRYPLNQHKIFVKRIVGLPGEEIAIKNGNLYNNSKIIRKPSNIQAELRHKIFDSQQKNISEFWQKMNSTEDEQDTSGWKFSPQNTMAFIQTEQPSWLRYKEEIWDVYEPYQDRFFWKRAYPNHVVNGQNRVGEIELHIEVTPHEHGQFLSEIRSGSRRFFLMLAVQSSYNNKISNVESMKIPSNQSEPQIASQLSIYNGENDIPEAQYSSSCCLIEGIANIITISNYDEQVHVNVNSHLIFDYDYATILEKAPSSIYDIEIYIGAQHGSFLFSLVQIYRDIYYISRHNLWAGAESWQIPTNSYFLLGDNSSNSHDSRDWQKFQILLNNGQVIEGDQEYPAQLSDEQYKMIDINGNIRYIPPANIKNGIMPSVPASFIERGQILGKAGIIVWPPPRTKIVQ